MREMRDHAKHAVEFARGKTRDDLDDDALLAYGLAHAIEWTGEAARRVPEATRRRHRAIDWVNVIEFRHRLAHGYDAVDYGRVWAVVTEELPTLIAQLDAILGPEETS